MTERSWNKEQHAEKSINNYRDTITMVVSICEKVLKFHYLIYLETTKSCSYRQDQEEE